MAAVLKRTIAPALFSVLRPAYFWVRGTLVGWLERRNGIETDGEIGLAELGIDGPDRSRYKPAGWFMLRRILPSREVGPGDVFLDVGSGMGRAVFQAAKDYPFRRVIGVELSEQLNDVARGNIDRNRHRLRCQDVVLLAVDAAEYQVPDDVTVVFLYNPFTGEIFAGFIRQLLASIDRSPRRVRVIYGNPIEHDLLMGTGRFREVKLLRGLRPDPEWSRSNSTKLYEVLLLGRRTPAPSAAPDPPRATSAPSGVALAPAAGRAAGPARPASP